MRARAIAQALCGGALVANAALFAGVAEGAERPAPPLELVWDVSAADCPDLDAARDSIRDFLGQRGSPHDTPAPTATAGSAIVRVRITEAPDGGYVAQITTEGAAGPGERRIEGATCARVAEAAALIVAMTLDPASVAQRVTGWKVSARQERPAPKAPPPRTEEHTQATLGVRASGDFGSLPAPSLGVGLSLGLHLARLHLEGEGTAWVAQEALGGPGPKTGGEIGLFTGALRGCLDTFDVGGELRLGPCLAGEAGMSTGRGFGISQPARSNGLWAAALAGFSAHQVGASPLTSWISLEVGMALRRPTYAIANYPPVFEPSLLVARASLGLAWIFP